MPLLVNMASGETLSFDLENEADARQWSDLSLYAHEEIRGISVKTGSVLHVLPVPRDTFNRIRWGGELILHRDGSGRVVGERATLYADEFAASILAYRSNRPSMVRYTLERTGKPVFQADPYRGANV